ncbi:VOC family protein [Streptomyces boluensis]|uniref:VOC family protein n=1 Tax=Streptomyces boluensis TaxID=1775135 RepID=A0A964XNA0_9ACTN|nr:VOC family protein [Streptomyces boluensis]NBE53363.1 VOC family protein [Streptomyces boluensis]
MTTPYPFIHHITVLCADFDASEPFYTAALAPLGVIAGDRDPGGIEYWEDGIDTPSFAVGPAQPGEDVTRGVHVAFTAKDRAAVDAFHAAALANGGKERHAPRLWPEYRAYCAFVSDPDGNNIEAVHKEIPEA